jgi:membrane-associated phospholipid phosphatase
MWFHMRNRVLLPFTFILIVIGFVSASFGQINQTMILQDKSEVHNKLDDKNISVNTVSLNRHYFESFLWDTIALPLSVVRWDKTDWLQASTIAGITVGFYHYDQKIQAWAQHKRNDISNHAAQFAEPFGGDFSLAPAGVLYLYGFLLKNTQAKKAALLAIESVVVSGLFTASIKEISHRHRPTSGDPYNRWDGPRFSSENQSFPSGHATAVFSTATIISSEYREKPLIVILSYGLATATALSRINDNKHWASDVIVGSVIGHFTAQALIRRHSRNDVRTYLFYPLLIGHSVGVSLSSRF